MHTSEIRRRSKKVSLETGARLRLLITVAPTSSPTVLLSFRVYPTSGSPSGSPLASSTLIQFFWTKNSRLLPLFHYHPNRFLIIFITPENTSINDEVTRPKKNSNLFKKFSNFELLSLHLTSKGLVKKGKILWKDPGGVTEGFHGRH